MKKKKTSSENVRVAKLIQKSKAILTQFSHTSSDDSDASDFMLRDAAGLVGWCIRKASEVLFLPCSWHLVSKGVFGIRTISKLVVELVGSAT